MANYHFSTRSVPPGGQKSNNLKSNKLIQPWCSSQIGAKPERDPDMNWNSNWRKMTHQSERPDSKNGAKKTRKTHAKIKQIKPQCNSHNSTKLQWIQQWTNK